MSKDLIDKILEEIGLESIDGIERENDEGRDICAGTFEAKEKWERFRK